MLVSRLELPVWLCLVALFTVLAQVDSVHAQDAGVPAEEPAPTDGEQPAALDPSLDADASVPDASLPAPVSSEAPDAALPLAPASDLTAPPSEAPSTLEVAPPAASPEASSPPPAIDVVARGESRAQRLERSSLPVVTLDLTEARRSSADLGELMARLPGVSVRRAGALGSDQRFSLAGFSDDQIRFFLDGIPLELSGYPFGLANVPVNAIGSVEVYSGVVPIRFGADALGGAVQLVSRAPVRGVHGTTSYQVGSFDTHRLTLSASAVDPKRGLLAEAAAFGDFAKNDYPVTVSIPDAQGRLSKRRVHRFHDGYRATGGNLTLGVTNRPWAQRLLLRGFFTEFRREVQNDPLMIKPYGAATQREKSTGTTLTYRHTLSERVKVDLVAGYTYGHRRFLDVAKCIYDWLGRCVGQRRDGGEFDGSPHDTLFVTHTGLARGHASLKLTEGHTLSVSVAPTYANRQGDERRQLHPDSPDPLNAERRLLTFVAGLEHKFEGLDDKLESLVFAKEYTQVARADEMLKTGGTIARDRETHRFGAGASVRYAFIEQLWTKLSYEYATRLPTIDEVFGNGVLIDQNLLLKPELSHNANLTLATRVQSQRLGRYAMEVTGFLREADQLINLIGTALLQRYVNVSSARSLGIQASGSASSKRDYVTLAANTTYQDFRNTSTEGSFANFNGDRITNRPYFFATGSARVQFSDLMAARDRISLTWVTRYTHSFFRSWESVGHGGPKATIDAQLVHALALMYLITSQRGDSISMSLDLQNLTNARVFDFFGVERPGRAAFFKITAEL